MSRITLEKLAEMIARGFEETTSNINTLTNHVLILEQGQQNLELGQKDIVNTVDGIVLRLDQMAPHFEVKDLNQRVTKIETHLGLQKC